MDKRAIIGIALSILVLVVYQQLVTHFYGPPSSTSAPETEKGVPEKATQPLQNTAPSPAPSMPAAPADVPASRSAKEITVETDNYTAVFTTQGARLKSFKLRRFRSSFEDNELVYSVQGGDLKLTGEAKATLVFQGQTSSGTVITKSFAFSGSAYPIQLEVSVKAADGTTPIPELLLTDKSDHSVPNHGAPFEGFIALVDSKIRREPPAEAAKGHEFSGDVSWAGFGHTYFFFALLPDNGAQHKLAVHQDGPALT